MRRAILRKRGIVRSLERNSRLLLVADRELSLAEKYPVLDGQRTDRSRITYGKIRRFAQYGNRRLVTIGDGEQLSVVPRGGRHSCGIPGQRAFPLDRAFQQHFGF